MISTIAAMVPTLLMLLFMALWIQSQRLLRQAWARESEYQRLIAEVIAASKVPGPGTRQ